MHANDMAKTEFRKTVSDLIIVYSRELQVTESKFVKPDIIVPDKDNFSFGSESIAKWDFMFRPKNNFTDS